nr:unnamed protein product [Callosobruchus chinensis]
MIEIWERKVLRNTFGGRKEPVITAVVKAQRVRMTPDRIPSMMLDRRIGGKKKRGRLKKRGPEQVLRDMEIIGKKRLKN